MFLKAGIIRFVFLLLLKSRGIFRGVGGFFDSYIID